MLRKEPKVVYGASGALKGHLLTSMKEGQEFPLPASCQFCCFSHHLPVMAFTYPLYPPTPSSRTEWSRKRRRGRGNIMLLSTVLDNHRKDWPWKAGTLDAGLRKRRKSSWTENRTERWHQFWVLDFFLREPLPWYVRTKRAMCPSETVARTKSQAVQGLGAEQRVRKSPRGTCCKRDGRDAPSHGNPGAPQVSFRSFVRAFLLTTGLNVDAFIFYAPPATAVWLVCVQDTSSCCQGNVPRAGGEAAGGDIKEIQKWSRGPRSVPGMERESRNSQEGSTRLVGRARSRVSQEIPPGSLDPLLLETSKMEIRSSEHTGLCLVRNAKVRSWCFGCE